MPRTNIQNNRRSLWNTVTKLKYLTKVSKSLAVIIPLTFLDALEINRETLLIMNIDTIDQKIIIKKVEHPEKYSIKKRGRNEKIDYIITE